MAEHCYINFERVMLSDEEEMALRADTKLFWRAGPVREGTYSEILLVSAESLERAADLFESPLEAVQEVTAPGLLARAASDFAVDVEEVWWASADQLEPGVVARSVAHYL